MKVVRRGGLVLGVVMLFMVPSRTALADCQKSAIEIGQTVTGSFDSNSCYGGPFYYVLRQYQFHALAGQTIVAKATVTEPAGVGMFLVVGSDSDLTFVPATSPGEATNSYTVPQTGNYLVGVDIQGPVTTSSYLLSLDVVSTGTCVPDVESLCLESGRYRVTSGWRTLDGSSGSGKAVPVTEDAGYFSFFDTANVEVFVKVLDGCSVNAKRWVFGAGLTDVEVTIDVTDTVTGETQTYSNAQGTAFQPIQDTQAFACHVP